MTFPQSKALAEFNERAKRLNVAPPSTNEVCDAITRECMKELRKINGIYEPAMGINTLYGWTQLPSVSDQLMGLRYK